MVAGSGSLPFQAVLALTEQLTGGSCHRLPWMQIRQILDDLTEGHFWLGYPMPGEWGSFRGRVDNGTDLFENVSQMSCRDPDDVKDYGRCHRPSVAVYYGANNLDTVLSELSPEVGDRVHVAVARPKVNAEIVLTAIGEIDHVRRYNRALIGNEETLTIIQGLLDNVKSESDLRKVFLDAFMSDLFLAPASHASDYKATSALSDIIFSASKDGKPILDGFAYPSVAHRGGMNFAVQGAAFLTKMAVTQCMAFEIIDYLGYGIYGRRQYAKSKSIASDGAIEWERM